MQPHIKNIENIPNYSFTKSNKKFVGNKFQEKFHLPPLPKKRTFFSSRCYETCMIYFKPQGNVFQFVLNPPPLDIKSEKLLTQFKKKWL